MQEAMEAESSKTRITLTGTQETLLVTLHCKLIDSQSPKPLLGDKWAGYVFDQIDYDFSKLGTPIALAQQLALRSRLFDQWTAEFLDAHEEATVLHLAAGLDGRALRLQRYLSKPGSRVRWIDVDFPEVAELRRKLLPEPEGDYRLIGSSATEEGWLESVPGDRPTFILFEGMSMYLEPEEGKKMIQMLIGHFPSGQLAFDSINATLIALHGFIKPIKQTGAAFRWAIDEPKDLESLAPGLKLRDNIFVCEQPGTDEMYFSGWFRMKVTSWVPSLRRFSSNCRYEF